MSLAASVDVGSNTLRLLIARVNNGGELEPVLLERQVTRLSQNLEPGGRLFGPARKRTLETLVRFGRLAADHGVKRIFGGATAAVRLAEDGDDFLDQAAGMSGLPLRKLGGREEARLTAMGVLTGLYRVGGPVLAVDPGGQSSEFVPIEGWEIKPGLSLNMGVVSLRERFLENDPPSRTEMAALEAEIRERLKEALAFYPPRPEMRLVGTAGTVTTIAAMLLKLERYDPARVTGFLIGLGLLDRLLPRVEAMPAADRRSLPGLEPGREDVILPGLVLVKCLIEVYGLKYMIAVDAGLLEGLIIDGLKLGPAAGQGR